MKFYSSIFFDLIVLFFSVLIYLIPRNKNIYLFTEWDGQPRGESPWVLFNSITNVQSYWISNDRTKHGQNGFVYKHSFQSYLLHFRAGTFVYSHNIRTQFLWPLSINAKKILIWHGVPLKKIGLQRSYTWSTMLWRAYNKIFRLRLSPINLVFCQSEYEKVIVAQAFNIDPNKIFVTGYPAFLKLKMNSQKNSNANVSFTDKVIYAPTLRNSLSDFNNLIIDCCEAVSKYSQELQFYIKLHPSQIIPDGYIFPSCLNLYIEPGIDYSDFRFVITDYSGVAVEALLCNCNLYIFSPDINSYRSTVGFNELFFKLAYDALPTLNEILDDIFTGVKHSVNLKDKDYYIGSIPTQNDVARIINAITH